MTTTATATKVRYFGKCATKGCKTRRVADGAGQMAINADGKRWRLNAHEYRLTRHERRQFWNAMASLDLVCVEHDRFLRWEGLRATYNPAKECSAKCMNASRPACDCSCNGENHGGAGVVSLA